jgi:hypothetical protein
MPIPVPCQATTGGIRRRRAAAGLAVAAVLALPGCVGSSVGSVSPESPAKVQPIAGSPVKQVTLTPRAAERLAIKTMPVTNTTVKLQPRTVIPYSAVIYDVDGTTWVYTMPAQLTYLRQKVTIQDVTGDSAVLSAGPPAGTAVVSEGAAMLYGTELGVGK